MLNLYRSRCISAGVYGAGFWVSNKADILQHTENEFLCRLLSVPGGTATLICHEELGMPYLEDHIGLSLLLLWVKIW